MPEPITDALFATKGIEYLLVIGFLLALVPFWRLLNTPVRSVRQRAPLRAGPAAASRWFDLPDHVYYHPGHTWAMVQPDGVVTVGLDDFAQKMIGQPDALRLPGVGTRVAQGGPGLRVESGSKSVELLSPIGGVVIDRNEEAVASPGLINRDPYGAGWLMKLRSPEIKANVKNLLSGGFAHAWMIATEQSLRHRMARDLGPVMQDGGLIVAGIARALDPEHWDEIAKDFFLSR
jgi:glycine cleavage system H lipoate-binding protein